MSFPEDIPEEANSVLKSMALAWAQSYTTAITQVVRGLNSHGFVVKTILVSPLDMLALEEIFESMPETAPKGWEPPITGFMEIPLKRVPQFEAGRIAPVTKRPEWAEGMSDEEISEQAPRIFGANADLN